MPRYFFNIKENDFNTEDLVGRVLPNLKAAESEAQKDIADIKRARFDTIGGNWPKWSIEVCDRHKLLLLVVPFSSN